MAGQRGPDGPVRNELFAGAQPTADPAMQPNEELSIDQLVQKADRTHQDTTAAARRALKVVKESMVVQENTMKELDEQGQRMNQTNRALNQLNQDLTYSERLLRYMRRCCCCWMCDSCTGADPETKMKGKWEKKVDKGMTARNDNSGVVVRDRNSRPQNGAAAGGRGSQGGQGAGPSGSQYRDPDIRLTEEHKGKELQMQAETRKQNEMLDEIQDGLGQLLNNAKMIGEELTEQNKAAEVLHNRVEATQGRIKEVNTKSQLGEFRVKQKK